ncbi:hypothetical protein WME91_37715 [Sorangium sp. So ce269]
MTTPMTGPRTYNQTHAPRKYAAGRRRVSVYVSWTYPGEANLDVNVLDDRYNTMFEFRRVFFPEFEWAASPLSFQQGIAGVLELILRTWAPFQQFAEEVTGQPVPLFQGIDQAGYRLPLDERVLADTDTLLVFGTEILRAQMEPSPDEIEAVRRFLAREGTCLIVGPHHDIGRSDDPQEREKEFHHHGDVATPRRQRFGGYARALLKGLGVPVENRWGLRSALVPGTRDVTPLSVMRDLDTRGFLAGVTVFNYHPHLPHYAVTTDDAKSVHVLARRPIDMTRPPHPFTEAGNREFNAVVWMPPGGALAGDVLVADSTLFSSLYGVTDSLKQLWRNIMSGGGAQ